MQFTTRNDKGLAHSAISVDSQHLQAHAAVGFATAAGNAVTTIEVRFDRAAVARVHILRQAAHRDDLYAKFVTENSRVTKKRLVSVEGVDIGAADADAAHPNQRLVRLKRGSGLIGGEQ